MSKRKLSQQQQWRIERVQQARLDRLQRSAKKAENLLAGHELGAEQPGLIIARYGATVDVEAKSGDIYHCYLRQNLADLVPGDNVVWRTAEQSNGVVTALLPRQSELARPDRTGNLKPLAANIDQMAIIMAPQPPPTLPLLDSYLVVAQLLNITPLIVFNKSDLLKRKQRLEFESFLPNYEKIGYQVLRVSATEARGLRTLQKSLRQKTSILVGQSGVGKSSLIQALLPDEQLRISGLSDKSGLGRHTTSQARLYHLPSGGDLIDSPGVRRFKLWKISKQQLLRGFIDLQPYASQCKFRDCTHTHEPECAILHALREEKIHPCRLESFHQLCDEFCE